MRRTRRNLAHFPLAALLLIVPGGGVFPRHVQAEHWAYLPPQRPVLPALAESTWPRSAIDFFTRSKMQRAGLRPSPVAAPETLVRRVTLDLTGLPPTPEELDAYLQDEAADAYERLVDRLLASPRYGERMATPWLDLARYADTHGFHMDAHREMWPWRDWIIGALNGNMPFDQFTVEQLAGDLLPGASLSQRIATGFNRNHMVNYEIGADPEEYRTEYVMDRVATTSTVWLGQTMQCCRCHDHKYDPLTQRDFYRLYAFFNHVPERGVDGDTGNAVPVIRAPTPQQQQALQKTRQTIAELQQALQRRVDTADEPFALWEQRAAQDATARPQPPADAALHLPLDETQGRRVTDRAAPARQVTVQGNPVWVPGRQGNGLLFDGDTALQVAEAGAFEGDPPFTWALWMFPTTRDRMTIVAHSPASEREQDYALFLDDRVLHFDWVQRADAGPLRFRIRQPLALYRWQHLVVVCDGTGRADGVSLYLDGRLQERDVVRDVVRDEHAPAIPAASRLRVGHDGGQAGFRGMLDDVRGYARSLTSSEALLLANQDAIKELLAKPREDRDASEQTLLRRYFLDHHDKEHGRLAGRLAAAFSERARLQKAIPTTMVMEDLPAPRETFILAGGRFDRPGEAVLPGTPRVLPPLPAEAPQNRLGLALWLVDPAHPLTARVAVNRCWQHFFGRGIVPTPEDFGVRGAPPSHPQLLDWLATELVRSGWDVKHIHRLIVTSTTYRQSSRVTPLQRERDPQNRWLARGARLRLDAETIRDSALFTAGLLEGRIGGPSVFPYQPAGLWEEVSYDPSRFTAQSFVQSHGGDLYRRSLYTFWKRSAPSPTLATLNAPRRETCTAVRDRANTPIQALVLMNDPTFVEAARGLAQRMMHLADAGPQDRVDLAFRWATSRRPTSGEQRVLVGLYREQRRYFRQAPDAGPALLAVGEAPLPPGLDPCELAAWTTVASTILCLDESITKN